jgi:hypothetical protein
VSPLGPFGKPRGLSRVAGFGQWWRKNRGFGYGIEADETDKYNLAHDAYAAGYHAGVAAAMASGHAKHNHEARP